jgi:hypothetical protein
MTVAELIEELQELPPESMVIIQRDADGNGYSPLDVVDGNAIYKAHSERHGEVISTDWTAEEACYKSEEEWERFKESNPRCCVLAPVL